LKRNDRIAWNTELTCEYISRSHTQRANTHCRTAADSFDHRAQCAAASARNNQSRRFRRRDELRGTIASRCVIVDQLDPHLWQFSQAFLEERSQSLHCRFALTGACRTVND
jgi:hypothetical protein